jgi:hypothetical protein
MIPHRPPEMHPLMLSMIFFTSLPLLGLVETETLFQVKTAGASEGEIAAKIPYDHD